MRIWPIEVRRVKQNLFEALRLLWRGGYMCDMHIVIGPM